MQVDYGLVVVHATRKEVQITKTKPDKVRDYIDIEKIVEVEFVTSNSGCWCQV